MKKGKCTLRHTVISTSFMVVSIVKGFINDQALG